VSSRYRREEEGKEERARKKRQRSNLRFLKGTSILGATIRRMLLSLKKKKKKRGKIIRCQGK